MAEKNPIEELKQTLRETIDAASDKEIVLFTSLLLKSRALLAGERRISLDRRDAPPAEQERLYNVPSVEAPPRKQRGQLRRRRRGNMSTEARKAVSERMKKYWAARRREKK
jgi:hypothetical protein